MAIVDARQFSAMVSSAKRAGVDTVKLSHDLDDFSLSFASEAGLPTILSTPVDADEPSITVEVKRSLLTSLSFQGDDLDIHISEDSVSFEEVDTGTFRRINAQATHALSPLAQATPDLSVQAKILLNAVKFCAGTAALKKDAVHNDFLNIYLGEVGNSIYLFSSNDIAISRVFLGETTYREPLGLNLGVPKNIRESLSAVTPSIPLDLAFLSDGVQVSFPQGSTPVNGTHCSVEPFTNVFSTFDDLVGQEKTQTPTKKFLGALRSLGDGEVFSLSCGNERLQVESGSPVESRAFAPCHGDSFEARLPLDAVCRILRGVSGEEVTMTRYGEFVAFSDNERSVALCATAL